MLYRKATQVDLPAATEIWAQAFGDTPEDALPYLTGYVGLENQFVAEDSGGQLLAILSAVPCTYGSYTGAYFFALATKSTWRGQGVMAGLIAHAEEQCQNMGVQFSCLIPAQSSLFGYYQKQGFQTVGLRALRCKPAAPQANFETLPLQPKALEEQRACYLPGGYLYFTPARMEYLLAMPRQESYALAVSAGGFAVYKKQGESLWVPECMAASTPAAEGLLAALCKKNNCTEAALTLAPSSPLFSGCGRVQPAAQYKPLAAKIHLEHLYLRFGLDEVFVKDYENPLEFPLR